jgi:hypothetical protein
MRPLTEAAYMYLTTLISKCSHFGHSKCRRSCRCWVGPMRASSISVPHLGHGCRTIACDSMVADLKPVIALLPLQAGARALSATDAWAEPRPVMVAI